MSDRWLLTAAHCIREGDRPVDLRVIIIPIKTLSDNVWHFIKFINHHPLLRNLYTFWYRWLWAPVREPPISTTGSRWSIKIQFERTFSRGEVEIMWPRGWQVRIKWNMFHFTHHPSFAPFSCEDHFGYGAAKHNFLKKKIFKLVFGKINWLRLEKAEVYQK